MMEHVSGSHLADFISETCDTVNTSDTSDTNVRSDRNCECLSSAVSGEIELLILVPYTTQKRISNYTSKSVSQSLPSLLTQDADVYTSSMPCNLSLPSSARSLPSIRISSSTKIPSSEVSTVVVDDSRIPETCETCVSSPRHHSMSDVEADSEVDLAFEPQCRICQLSGESDSSLISPCRCSGSLQYTHTACLVVS